MKFLLDTNAIIAILKGEPKLSSRLRQHQPKDFGMPSIVVHELFYGAYKGQRVDENISRIAALQFSVVDFDQEDARCAGQIRAELSAHGTTIGPYDSLIAGQALARGLVLVSRNTREFQRVRNLIVEDWES